MNQDWIDKPTEVRASEQLDAAALETHLRSALPDIDGPLVIEQFPKGHSNLTYMIRFGDKEMVLRRPPFGAKIKSAHDMGREHRILSALDGVWDKAPRPVLYCEDESVLGAPFYLMERVQGVILRGMRAKEGMTPALMRSLSETLVDTLVELHGVDLEAAGMSDFGRPEGYVTRQITGWTKRYQKAQTDDVPQLEQVMAWLADNMPAEAGATLIHNDYKYDNVVLDANDPTRVVAVLDWEMATVGDPLMDLGTSLGYWFTAGDAEAMRQLPFGPTVLPGNLTRQQVVDRYVEKSGREIGDPLFYYVYAVFKIAVIIQQIYARFKRGLTDDPRFAMFGFGVQLLAQRAAEALDAGTIDPIQS